jgi:nanoRNase/pAp phosphatase (c-di-AMP/oligoRNAs hydrolase)
MLRLGAGGVGDALPVGPVPVDAAQSLVRSNPLLVAGATVVVALLVVLGWVVRRLLRSTGERFRRHLASVDEVAVLMHPNPDPDAMSCALAVYELASAVDTDATLQYSGQIRHQENRAFETVLDLEFEHVNGADDIAAETVVLVDHNEPRGFSGATSVTPFAVVDHHPGDGTGSEFTDVRSDHGSCASIFAEYFRQLGYEPLVPDEETEGDGQRTLPSTVATGLLYGIQSDTKNLTKGCSEAEFEASAYLYGGIDEDRLDRIANPQVDAEVLDVKARAIELRQVRNAFAVSDVGEVSNVDAIPQAADELSRLEGVTAVVVMGQKGDTIHLSGRSRDDRVHMGRALDAAVEEIPMASAGGHARMGGGQVSVDHMEGIGPSQGVDRELFTDRLFDAMAGDVW